MAAETVYFDEGDVKVTNARVVIKGQTYAVANITSVVAVKVPNILFRLGCGAFIALSSILVIVTGIVVGGEERFGMVGAAVVLFFVAIWLMRGWWSIEMVTSANELSLLGSQDKSRILRVVDAINEAIAHRG